MSHFEDILMPFKAIPFVTEPMTVVKVLIHRNLTFLQNDIHTPLGQEDDRDIVRPG